MTFDGTRFQANMLKLNFILAILPFSFCLAVGTDISNNPKVIGRSEYIECVPGTLNVILASPHGGYEEPDTITDRDAGCFVDGQCVWSHDCGEKDFDE